MELVQASRQAIKNEDFEQLIKITLHGTDSHDNWIEKHHLQSVFCTVLQLPFRVFSYLTY